MKELPRTARRTSTWLVFAVVMIVAVFGAGFFSTNNVSANHPVLVEGNCDSPVPGTTIVEKGTCGDFDGDGRIGTAEDTDGADRIFGTINAALGPGTGAAAGTGANFNGTITIVKSGRFSELIMMDQIFNTIGNITLQAAPGVEAQIDAVFQGDPSGGNNFRQGQPGILIRTPPDRRVILRNLTIRNWLQGVTIAGDSRVTIDNCRIENNLNNGVFVGDNARLFISHSRVTATGYRVGTVNTCPSPSCTPSNGSAIAFVVSASGAVFHTQISNNFGNAIFNISSLGAGAVRYYEVFQDGNGGGILNATRENAP